MDKESISLLIVGVLALIVLIAAIYKKKQKTSLDEFALATSSTKVSSRDWLKFIYYFYQYVPGFKKLFEQVKKQIEVTFPADAVSISKRVSRELLRLTIIGIACVVLVVVLGNTNGYLDPLYISVGAVATVVAIMSAAKTKSNKLQLELLTQFGESLETLKIIYEKRPIIEDALYSLMAEVPHNLSLHIFKLYQIVDSPDMEEELNAYIGHEPNKFMLMFLSICTSIKKHGDPKLKNGQSAFLEDIMHLEEEINQEILNKENTMMAFSFYPIWCLALIFLWKPCESLVNSMFDASSYYHSAVGIMGFLFTAVFTIACHTLEISLRDSENEAEEKDNGIFKKISDMPLVKPLLTKIVNKHYSTYRSFDEKRRGLGNHTGPRAFLAQQIVLAASTFIIIILLFISTSIIGKFTAIHNFTKEFDSVNIPSEEYIQTMREVAADYTKVKRFETVKDMELDALTDDIAANTAITNKTHARLIAEAVVSHVTDYQHSTFWWYEILLALALAAVAFMAPIWYLKVRYRTIELRKEEEVIRFQSLMLILMHLRGMTIEKLLDWVYTFSYCFRETINTCIINISSGEQEALEEMKESEFFQPFRNFCDNLIAIDAVGIESAFSQIELSRTQYLKKRERNAQNSLETRENLGFRIAIMAFAVLSVFAVVIPLGIYFANLLTEFEMIYK